MKSSTRDISKLPGKLTKGILFHQDNAPAYKSVVAMAAVRDCDFKLIDHPPDFAPSDYFLFPNMKLTLGWTSYEVISAVEDVFKDQDESLYTRAVRLLQHGWKKYVGCRGDC